MPINQTTFFGESFALDALALKGDPLVALARYIDFEAFRPELTGALKRADQLGQGGRPAWDAVLVFKMLVLQRLYNLSDDQTEYQTRDRLSFHRFLDLGLGDKVPDSRTLWLYRETWMKAAIFEELFKSFNRTLSEQGVFAKNGSVVDATFVEVPKQRNTREENKKIKEGQTPTEWTSQPRKLAQKDVQARWTMKRGVAHYGYKNHTKIDAQTELITACQVTSAEVHDSQVFKALVDDEDAQMYADSAYKSATNDAYLRERNIDNQIHAKGCRYKTVSEAEKQANRVKSEIRAKVEHPFAYMNNSMGGLGLEYIGLRRVESATFLLNLVYNFRRFIHLLVSGKVQTSHPSMA
jgi:IS5 family transposase